MALRIYQQECLDSIISEARGGCLKQVVVLPTGSGKTHIFAQLPSLIRDKGKKTLILAHREELLLQAKNKLLEIDPTLKVEVEMAEQRIDEGSLFGEVDVVLGSVQTLGRAGSKRIEKFNPNDFGLVICDEVHHATSKSYLNIFRYFGVLKGEEHGNKKLLLGVTATPNRSDHVGLDTVFDKIVYTYPLRKAIQDGFLCDIKAFTVATKTDISGVHTSMGDFQEGELGEAVNTEERNKLIVDSYRDIAPDSKAIVFCVNVEHTKFLTEYFKRAGIKAEYVLGETEKDVRKKVISDFKENKIKVMLGCGVFTEGFDEPSIETVVMARPTKSSVLYMQMAGRGLRLCEGKDHLKLIDLVDNTGKNSIMTLPNLFGIPKTLKGIKGKKITEVAAKAERLFEVYPDYPLDEIEDWSDENIDKIIKEVDIFAKAELDTEIKAYSKYAWERYGEGYRIKFPDTEGVREILTIQTNMLYQHEVRLETLVEVSPSYMNGWSKWGKKGTQVLGQFNTVESAIKEGDSFISTERSQFRNIYSQNAAWRVQLATSAQLNLMRKFHIPTPKNLTKGQASILIGSAMNERNKRY